MAARGRFVQDFEIARCREALVATALGTRGVPNDDAPHGRACTAPARVLACGAHEQALAFIEAMQHIFAHGDSRRA